MSHASVIIAIEPTHKLWTAGIPDQAIAWEMEPFDENGEWFANGSRWDWFTVGGRFSGKFCGENVALVKNLFPNKYLAYQEKKLRDCYEKAMADLKSEEDWTWVNLCYGVKQGESEADFVQRETQGAWFPSAVVRQKHFSMSFGLVGHPRPAALQPSGMDLWRQKNIKNT